MTEKHTYTRRHYLINRKFQLEFSFRFLLIIAAASIAVLALFYYISRGTMTAGYTGSEVKLLQTSAYFLPSLIVATVGVILLSCLAGIVAIVLISHRIAGPLFRFQATLDRLVMGDLTVQFKLRNTDQFMELADRINALASTMDGKIGGIQTKADEIFHLVEAMQSASALHPALSREVAIPLQEMAAKMSELRDAVGLFKTSPPGK